ncbi:unnamed protein product, partial [Mesorhabditis spiculigera]
MVAAIDALQYEKKPAHYPNPYEAPPLPKRAAGIVPAAESKKMPPMLAGESEEQKIRRILAHHDMMEQAGQRVPVANTQAPRAQPTQGRVMYRIVKNVAAAPPCPSVRSTMNIHAPPARPVLPMPREEMVVPVIRKCRAPLGRQPSNKGLKTFSAKVRDKVRVKGTTTYTQVADELVDEYFNSLAAIRNDKIAQDTKNIRRRVYDALNVFIALKMIRRDKKQIHWSDSPFKRESPPPPSDITDLEAKIRFKTNRIRHLVGEIVGRRNLCIENQVFGDSEDRRNPEHINDGAFVIFSTPRGTKTSYTMSSPAQVVVEFGKTPTVLSDIHMLQTMGHDMGIMQHGIRPADLDLVKKMVPRDTHAALPHIIRPAPPDENKPQKIEE